MPWPRLALVLGLGLSLPFPGRCLAADAPALTYDSVDTKWTVAPDGTAVLEAEVSLRLAKGDPTRVLRVPLLWSSGETLAVTGIRVEKPGGLVLRPGEEAVREAPFEGDRDFHVYSDLRRLVVTLPNVGADDLVVLRVRRVLVRPRVPGGFTIAHVLARWVGWEETTHTISLPSSLPFRFEERGFEHQSEVILDRTVHYIRSRAPLPAVGSAV